MKSISKVLYYKHFGATLIFDIAAFLLIYFIPAISHVINLHIYIFEPMRFMLIMSIVYTSKRNSLLIALTMPLFSYITSGHPEILKMTIITIELLINVVLFYLLSIKYLNFFTSMFLAIVLSKILCYSLYFYFFSFTFFLDEANPYFIFIQLLVTIILSIYVSLNYKKKDN